MKAREVASYAADAVRPIRPRHVAAVYRTAKIRRIAGAAIAGDPDLRSYTAGRFADARKALATGGAEAAIIPVLDEAADLPGTLLSMAKAGNVYPVVIDNGSHDSTAQIAADMGAAVRMQPKGRKMAATQAGAAFVQGELRVDTMLATDGDTLVLPTWADTMRVSLDHAGPGEGRVAYGATLQAFGPSKLADVAASGLNLMYGHMHQRRGELPDARGGNYGVRFDSDGVVMGVIQGMDPDLFMGRDPSEHEDLQVRNALAAAEVAIEPVLDPAGLVLTRNDRGGSVRDVLAAATGHASSVDQAMASYEQQYGPLPGSVGYLGDKAA